MKNCLTVLMTASVACSPALPDLIESPVPTALSFLDLRGQYETGVEGTIATLPLNGARVELMGVGLVTHTDVNGEFSFLQIPVAALSNRLEFLVFDPLALESDPPIARFVELISETTAGSVTFTKKIVNPRGALTGRVDLVGDDNDGGVLVYAEGLPGVDDLTGPDGSFVLLGIPAGPVRIHSNRDGFLPTPEVVEIEAQAYLRLPIDEPILLNPLPGQGATAATGGRVLTADGLIPPDSEVWAVPQISGGMIRIPVASDGSFSAALNHQEPHQLVLKSGGQVTTARLLQVEPGRQDLVLIGLPLAADGDDRDGDGRPSAEDPDDTDPHSWSDLDGDGLGDIHDADDDGDGVTDMEELCPGRDGQTSDPQDSTDGAAVFGGFQRLEGGDGHFWSNGVSPLSSQLGPLPPEAAAGFATHMQKRVGDFGTQLLFGPYRLVPGEGEHLEFRASGYLGHAEELIELVTMPAAQCDAWSEEICGAPFGRLQVGGAALGIVPHLLSLEAAGRGRFKMSLALDLSEPSWVWVWLPGGGASTPLCGNGSVDAGEVCDDGNEDEDDDCTTACRRPTCGDGIMQPRREEGCDDGNGDPRDACAHCIPARCGDSIQRVDLLEGQPESETCDDGNEADGDGCASDCSVEEGARCFEQGLGSLCTTNGPGTLGPLAVGYNHGCSIRPSGETQCWGRNDSRQLGSDQVAGSFSASPVRVSGDHRFQQVVAGAGHTCARDQFGKVWCWGANDRGQLGIGEATGPSPVPVLVGDNLAAMSTIATDGFHSCGISYGESELWCWGANDSGQLFFGDSAFMPTPVDNGMRGVVDVGLGEGHTCAVISAEQENGGVYCWGANGQGALGNGNPGTDPVETFIVPGLVEGLPEVSITKLAVSSDHSCALASDGSVYCWGNNEHFELGSYQGNHSSTAVLIIDLPVVDRLVAGDHHNCARIAASGKVLCWGNNTSGQVDSGLSAGLVNHPIAVDPMLPAASEVVVALGAGDPHSCAQTPAHDVYCWGGNNDGQLGNGNRDASEVPVLVSFPP